MADGAVAFGELGSGNICGEKGVTEEGAVAAASISFLRRGGIFLFWFTVRFGFEVILDFWI